MYDPVSHLTMPNQGPDDICSPLGRRIVEAGSKEVPARFQVRISDSDS